MLDLEWPSSGPTLMQSLWTTWRTRSLVLAGLRSDSPMCGQASCLYRPWSHVLSARGKQSSGHDAFWASLRSDFDFGWIWEGLDWCMQCMHTLFSKFDLVICVWSLLSEGMCLPSHLGQLGIRHSVYEIKLQTLTPDPMNCKPWPWPR